MFVNQGLDYSFWTLQHTFGAPNILIGNKLNTGRRATAFIPPHLLAGCKVLRIHMYDYILMRRSILKRFSDNCFNFVVAVGDLSRQYLSGNFHRKSGNLRLVAGNCLIIKPLELAGDTFQHPANLATQILLSLQILHRPDSLGITCRIH